MGTDDTTSLGEAATLAAGTLTIMRLMRRVEGPGVFHGYTPAEYHADLAPEPSCSASVAIALVESTPFRAWMKSPRLNRAFADQLELDVDDADSKRALGSVAHELLIGQGKGIHVISETKDAKGKVIKAPTTYNHDETKRLRDDVLRQGAVPCLECELDLAEEIVENVRDALVKVPGCERAFLDGYGEVPAVAYEPELGIWTRMLVDWWGPEPHKLFDLKSTSGGLSDEALKRRINDQNLDLRAAFYERVGVRLFPELAGRFEYHYVFAEAKPPFDLRVVRLDRGTMAQGHKKVAYALRRWKDCLASGQWPTYPAEVTFLGAPGYASQRWTERETMDPDVYAAIQADPFVQPIVAEDEPFADLTAAG